MGAERTIPSAGPRKVYRVCELSFLIKQALQDGLPPIVCVLGEVSKVNYHSSGHLYFTLKDEDSVVECKMWRPQVARVPFRLEVGTEVVACGTIDLYVPQGRYSLMVQTLEPRGVGALQIRFEQMKKKLEEEGLFSAERKRPLPFFPSHIGILTSRDGAALHDILDSIYRRHPNASVVFVPVPVQGEGSAEKIAATLLELNLQRHDLEVIIIGRGGGSLEDLWAFNEEVLARAIAQSRIPVVSAVGHETDFTIADFVADVRAKTPTEAGEIVVPDVHEWLLRLDEFQNNLYRLLRERVNLIYQQLHAMKDSHGFQMLPAEVIHRHEQLDESAARLPRALVSVVQHLSAILEGHRQALAPAHLKERIARRQDLLNQIHRQWESQLKMLVKNAKEKLGAMAGHLEALSPLAILGRGYSITQREDGSIVTQGKTLSVGQLVRTKFADGWVSNSLITGTSPPPDNSLDKGASDKYHQS